MPLLSAIEVSEHGWEKVTSTLPVQLTAAWECFCVYKEFMLVFIFIFLFIKLSIISAFAGKKVLLMDDHSLHINSLWSQWHCTVCNLFSPVIRTKHCFYLYEVCVPCFIEIDLSYHRCSSETELQLKVIRLFKQTYSIWHIRTCGVVCEMSENCTCVLSFALCT